MITPNQLRNEIESMYNEKYNLLADEYIRYIFQDIRQEFKSRDIAKTTFDSEFKDGLILTMNHENRKVPKPVFDILKEKFKIAGWDISFSDKPVYHEKYINVYQITLKILNNL